MNTDKTSDLRVRVITAALIVLVIGAVIFLGIKLDSALPLLALGTALLLAASRELAVATFTPNSILTEAIIDGASEGGHSNSQEICASVAISEQPEEQPTANYLALLRTALLAILMCAPLKVSFDLLRGTCCSLSIGSRLAGVTIASLILILFLACIAGRRRLSFGARTLISGIVGFTLLSLGGAQMLMLASQPWMLITLIVAVAVNDSMAYFVGRAIGGMRLAPAISPKKTFSGSIAGLIGGVAVGLVIDRAHMETGILGHTWLWVALIISAQMADLAKSLIKREFLIKDFAATLPGHGGVFDRIDGILGACLGLLLIGAM